MKKSKNKKRKLPRPSAKVFKRSKSLDEKVSDAISTVPRITNETLTDHREDVLSSARKYIYPLQHSKHKVVRISISIFVLVIVAFFVFCGIDLYKLQGTSGFIYDVTKIIPFPVAKADGSWISYESYLFELRRNMHYYATQQQANFSSKDGKSQLARLKQQSMANAEQEVLVAKLAKQNGVSVSSQAVDNEVNLLRSENRLGSSDHVFREVLSQYYGWSEADFKRELQMEMLQQALVAKLDTGTNNRAESTLKQLEGGADFATLAGQVSDDPQTKGTGGQYPGVVTINDQQIPPVITNALFQMKAGQISGIINTGYSLDILKVIDKSGDSLHAAHIQFNLKDVSTYIGPIEKDQPLHKFISV
jgi:foldase protein PrsA